MFLNRLAGCVAAAAIAGVAPALADNFEFVVPGEPGLDLRITGYGSDGAEIFADDAPSLENRNGAPVYVIRVDDTLLRGSGFGEWCVEDRSGRWEMLPEPGARVMLCDDQPSETRGSYGFTHRTERALGGTPAPEAAVAADAEAEDRPEKLLVACIQSELNWKGYDTGRPDGVIGNRTRSAAEAYLAATPGSGLAPLAEDNLGQWCDALAVHAPKPVVIETQGDIGPFEGNLEERVRNAEAVLIEAFGISPRETITFFVSGDEEWLTENYLRMNGLPGSFRRGKLESFGACDPVAEFAYRSVFVCTETSSWNRGRVFQQMVLGHEYFHALSGDLGAELGEKACCYEMDRMGPLGPEWLKEGGAQYAALVSASELGLSNFEQDIRRTAREIRTVDLSLSGRNTRQGFNGLGRDKSELVGIVASHILAERSGRQSIANYYRYLGYGRGHEEAFRAAFGLDMDDLEALVEAYVAGQ